MRKFIHAVVLAAGRGERMLPLTLETPKALLSPDGDATLLQHQLRRLRPHTEYLHVTVGYLGPRVAAHAVESGADGVVAVAGHGNAWWIGNSPLALVDAPVLVSTCDNLMEVDLQRVHADYDRLGAPPCMVVPVPPEEGIDGDYILSDGPIVRALTRESVTDRYCSGLQVLRPTEILRVAGPVEDFRQVWQALMAVDGLLAGSVMPTRWIGVDDPAQLGACSEWLASAPAAVY